MLILSGEDVLLVNQTSDTMQNLVLDFATLGDLKLVERPTVHTLAPHSFLSIKATIKACLSVSYDYRVVSLISSVLFDRSRQQRLVLSLETFFGRVPGLPSRVSC